MKTNEEIKKLEQMARQVRKDIIEMLAQAGSGHFSVMRHNPQNRQWRERGRFILSRGHSCPAMYACLARAGYFPLEGLKAPRKLEILGLFLKEHGYRFLEARDGKQAITKVKEDKPEIAILDLGMPRASGMEFSVE
ncbi:MAG: response regulator [bacterium]